MILQLFSLIRWQSRGTPNGQKTPPARYLLYRTFPFPFLEVGIVETEKIKCKPYRLSTRCYEMKRIIELRVLLPRFSHFSRRFLFVVEVLS